MTSFVIWSLKTVPQRAILGCVSIFLNAFFRDPKCSFFVREWMGFLNTHFIQKNIIKCVVKLLMSHDISSLSLYIVSNYLKYNHGET
jgi:hypothetical protein